MGSPHCDSRGMKVEVQIPPGREEAGGSCLVLASEDWGRWTEWEQQPLDSCEASAAELGGGRARIFSLWSNMSSNSRSESVPFVTVSV